mgnify:FL=1
MFANHIKGTGFNYLVQIVVFLVNDSTTVKIVLEEINKKIMISTLKYLEIKKYYFFLFTFCFLSPVLLGQKNISFKDSLDHKIDLSDWVITSKGFIPVPYLITEPALGGIGGALIPVFIKPNTPYLDSIDG